MSGMRSVVRGAVVAVGALGLMLTGFVSPANALAPVFQAEDVSVRIVGGEATALNQCINDAQDGVINTQTNSCEQVATGGNSVILDNVTAIVMPKSGVGAPLFYGSNVTAEVSGGLMSAMNLCLNDSKDGLINTQLNACKQSATAGNTLMLTGVAVTISR
ncbi:MAG: hypothetical protein QG622_2937 [Actinomycetota bacterium]|nr:hypothetical protein [Actinomycetota bacterium]